ncbi:MAG TPA: response regulator [Candidatus Hydrogenedentes bacterium]|nr:response regulator [Candidatus Hydrogenedentota bacterium]
MENLILIAADEPKNQKLVCDLLTFAGYATLEAPNAVQLIDMAEIHQPQLILMDVQMPFAQDLDTARTLKGRSTTHAIPLVALTAMAMPGDKDEILKAGFNYCFTKPLDTRAFMKFVKKLMPGPNKKSTGK